MDYTRTVLPEKISVRAIRTAYSFDFRDKPQNHVGEAHDFPELIYLRSGSLTVRVGDKRVELSAGQMTVYGPNAYHIGEASKGLSIYIISFDSDSEALSALYGRPITLSARQSETLTDVIGLALSLFERVPRGEGPRGVRKKEGASDFELQRLKASFELLLLDICEKNALRAAPEGGQKELLLFQICEYLRENIHGSVSLDDVSRHFHIGKSSLTALFRLSHGMGMTSYFNRLRIDEAKRLICESSMNFTEISDALGFASVHYFSRLFKKTEGMTPSEYMKLYRAY